MEQPFDFSSSQGGDTSWKTSSPSATDAAVLDVNTNEDTKLKASIAIKE